MKNKTKIIAWLLILIFIISNVSADWFPDEPMVIYWNITWDNTEWKNLKISNWTNKTLKEIKISWSKYGTDKSLDINNKILLNTYDWELKFNIDWYNFKWASKWDTTSCNISPIFQKWNICQYNLSFQKINLPTYSSWWGWWGYSGWWSHTYKTKTTTHSTSNTIKKVNKVEKNNLTKKELKNKNIKTSQKNIIKKDSKWKIIIKSKDYIKVIKNFNSNLKEEKNIFWYKVLTLKWNDNYNKNIEKFTKKIYNEIKLDWIRKSMIKYLNTMNKTAWILLDESLNDNLRNTFKEKLKQDQKYLSIKMKKLKRKDEIIRYVLNKRKNN